MDKLCGNCFQKMSSDICPHCGYNEAEQRTKYPLALYPGSILNGRYIVGRVLGQGGFGITYNAWDYQNKELIAMKEYLPTEYAVRTSGSSSVQIYSGERKEFFDHGKEQFLAEAKTLAEFNGNKHIVQIYCYFEENNTAYFAMEYVDGESLDKYMKNCGGRLSIDTANKLLLPVMDALDLVHSKGIVHRDIAPDNILVKKDGTAKLIDFGAARYSNGEKSKSLDVILKLGFAPREQYMRRGRQGPFTDVYAMAATYYYALTGKMPPEALARMDEDELIEPSTLGIKMPGKAENVLMKALEVSAQDRYQTMGQFRAALEAERKKEKPEPMPELEAIPTPNPAPKPQVPAPESKPDPATTPNPPSKPKKLVLIAAVAAVALAIGAFALLPKADVGSIEIKEPATIDTATISTEIFAPLEISRSYPVVEAVGNIQPFGNYYYNQQAVVNGDLTNSRLLAYSLNISNRTHYTSIPDGFDKDALIEWGKYPGLNIDILHEHGFTGKGATIAYVDQPIVVHEQYADINLHYTNNTSSNNSMHGPMVLSLLAGKDTGTAPEAEVYYYAMASWETNQERHAECLYQIIEQNNSLPDGEKITMVGFSDNIDSSEANPEALREAVKACEDAGVMVFFCGDYSCGNFLPMSDRNDPQNVVPVGWGGGNVVVPSSGRTGAGFEAADNYYYWAQGGLSWTMPYVLGLYSIVNEIDPSLTKDDLLTMLSETATEANGISIINPVEFVSSALERVDRMDEANELRRAVKERQNYLYAVMNTKILNESELNEIGASLAAYDGVEVIVVDTADVPDANTLYKLMKEDAEARGGKIIGVKVFDSMDGVAGYNADDMLSYHDFGVLDPDIKTLAFSETKTAVVQAGQILPKITEQNNVNNGSNNNRQDVEITEATVDGDKIILQYDTENRGNVDWKIIEYTAQSLDNGRYRFELKHNAGKSLRFSAFDPPNGENFMYIGTGEENLIVYEMAKEEIPVNGTITVNIDNASFFVFFRTNQLK